MAPADNGHGDLRSASIQRGAQFGIEVDGRTVIAHDGESILAALWAAGIHQLHVTARGRQPRGFLCGIGVCFDCLVTVDDRVNVRACVESAMPKMRIRTQHDAGRLAQNGRAHGED